MPHPARPPVAVEQVAPVLEEAARAVVGREAVDPVVPELVERGVAAAVQVELAAEAAPRVEEAGEAAPAARVENHK